MRARICLITAFALCVVLAAPVLADTRKDNIDVVIALDKSLSMDDSVAGQKKVDAVKDWVNTSIIDQLLIPGDYLVVVAFYGKADLLISQSIKGDSDKAALKKIISQIRGNGRYTDIGNALDAIKQEVATRETDGREKYVLLLTDGIQEAPPTSKYYSKDGKFNHEFLANTKTIQEMGWKVMILGIGTGSAAKDLAGELQGSYNEITSNLTAGAITQQTSNLFGEIAVQGGVRSSPVSADGTSRVSITLKPSGLSSDVTITVNGIKASIGGKDIPNLLAAPFSFAVKKDGTSGVGIPISFGTDLPQGPAVGTLTFSFATAERFSPASLSVSFTPRSWLGNTWAAAKSWAGNNLLLLGGAVLALLIIVALIILLMVRLTQSKRIRFAVVIEGEEVGEAPTTLAPGRQIFLAETAGTFSLLQRRNAKAIARFAARDGKLVMSVLKQDRFPKLKEDPAEARGHTFPFRSENGRSLSLKVQSKERTK